MNCQRLTCWLSKIEEKIANCQRLTWKIEEKNCELSKDCPILVLMLMTHSPLLILHGWKWILYSQGRVWVHHLSSTKGYCWFSLADPVFFCLCANEWWEKSHHWNGNWRWWPLPIAIPAVAATDNHHSSSALNSSSGGELTLYLSWKRNMGGRDLW